VTRRGESILVCILSELICAISCRRVSVYSTLVAREILIRAKIRLTMDDFGVMGDDEVWFGGGCATPPLVNMECH
jgi:hypothetical protein